MKIEHLQMKTRLMVKSIVIECREYASIRNITESALQEARTEGEFLTMVDAGLKRLADESEATRAALLRVGKA